MGAIIKFKKLKIIKFSKYEILLLELTNRKRLIKIDN
tara:strand:+ start:471 stop:581 length:111 start_codon:yes stop_codon:yes gene_type:complete